jgi:hypothetical protein
MVDILQRAVLRLWADGGQGRARRNAWAAMVVDSQRSRVRSEVTESLLAAGRAAELADLAAAPVRAHG